MCERTNHALSPENGLVGWLAVRVCICVLCTVYELSVKLSISLFRVDAHELLLLDEAYRRQTHKTCTYERNRIFRSLCQFLNELDFLSLALSLPGACSVYICGYIHTSHRLSGITVYSVINLMLVSIFIILSDQIFGKIICIPKCQLCSSSPKNN